MDEGSLLKELFDKGRRFVELEVADFEALDFVDDDDGLGGVDMARTFKHKFSFWKIITFFTILNSLEHSQTMVFHKALISLRNLRPLSWAFKISKLIILNVSNNHHIETLVFWAKSHLNVKKSEDSDSKIVGLGSESDFRR